MFQRFDKPKQCVQAVLSDRNVVGAGKEKSLSLTTAQWNRIASLLPALEGLEIDTTAMPTEQNVSASCILPVVHGLKINVLKQFQLTVFCVKASSRQCLQTFLGDFLWALELNSVIAIAACLDPRHKSLTSLSKPLRLVIHEHVRSLVDDINEESSICTDMKTEPPAKISAMALILGEEYYGEQQSLCDEFTSFIEEPPLHPDSNPLLWRMRNERQLPKVATVAGRYLSAPATSVPKERVFSTAGNIVTQKRCSLLSENVNCLVLLNVTL